jgi:hypothetical protein
MRRSSHTIDSHETKRWAVKQLTENMSKIIKQLTIKHNDPMNHIHSGCARLHSTAMRVAAVIAQVHAKIAYGNVCSYVCIYRCREQLKDSEKDHELGVESEIIYIAIMVNIPPVALLQTLFRMDTQRLHFKYIMERVTWFINILFNLCLISPL